MVRHVSALWQIASGSVVIPDAGGANRAQRRAWWEILGILVTSFVVLGGGLYVMLGAGFDESQKKWASGVIGAVAGYWLK